MKYFFIELGIELKIELLGTGPWDSEFLAWAGIEFIKPPGLRLDHSSSADCS